MIALPARLVVVVLAVLVAPALVACPAPTPHIDAGGPGLDAGPADDDGGGAGDAGDDDADASVDAGGAPDAGWPAGPSVAATLASGAFLGAPVRDVLTSSVSSKIIVGTQGVPVDPRWLGLPVDQTVLSGLAVHDRATGATRVYGVEDGVPAFVYGDDFQTFGSGAAPVFDLAWTVEGEAFVSASWGFVMRGAMHDDGAITFTTAALRAPDAVVDMKVTSVAVAGGELFVGGDQGVAVVDPASLALLRFIDAGTTWALAAGDLLGDAVVAITGDEQGPRGVAVLRPGSATTTNVSLPVDERPTAALGMDGAFLVGTRDAQGKGRIHALGDTLDGFALTAWAAPIDLTTATFGAVVPGHLAYDPVHERVLVGGQLQGGSFAGGGLVALGASADGGRTGAAVDVVEARDPAAAMMPPMVDVLVVDDEGRTYVAGRELCSETRLGRLPLLRVDVEDDASTRVLRPFVSGVRTVSIDPLDGATWLGLRDDNPGLRCDGVVVAQATCRLRADGACEIFTPYVNTDPHRYPASIGPSAIAFSSGARPDLAIIPRRNEVYVQIGGTSRAIAVQLDPSLNLEMTSGAWGESGLWIGSEMHWQTYNDPSLDEVAINARGPHGLGYLEFQADGRTLVSRRYVSEKPVDSLVPDEVEGLPSNWVWDVLPLPGHRRALVALGVERRDRAYDHILPEPSGQGTLGGLALIDDADVHNVAAPAGVPLEDVVALARGPGDVPYALDATHGVVAVDVATATSTAILGGFLPADVRATALAVDVDGTIAIGHTHGVVVFDAAGGRTDVEVAGGTGLVWSIDFLTPGVLVVGCDRGVVEVALGASALPAALGPAEPFARSWAELDWGCYGAIGCPCEASTNCIDGAVCDFAALEGPVCAAAPIGCGGVADCACDAETPCADGLSCGAGATCEAIVDDACAADCTCATASGCPEGQTCIGGFAGDTCT